MREIVILISTLFLFNCGSTKTSISETQEWINAQNFTLNKPNNWKAIKFHGYVGYIPIKRESSFVSVYQYEFEEKTNFKKFVQNQIEQTNESLNIISQEILTNKSQLGDVYIHKTESTFKGKVYKRYTLYFEQNGEYYNYNYSSLKDHYEEHFEEAISVLYSIAFK